MIYNKYARQPLAYHLLFKADDNDTVTATADEFQEMFADFLAQSCGEVTLGSFDWNIWESSVTHYYDKNILGTYVLVDKDDEHCRWVGVEGHHGGQSFRIVLYDGKDMWRGVVTYGTVEELLTYVNKVVKWAANPNNTYRRLLNNTVDYADAREIPEKLLKRIWGTL